MMGSRAAEAARDYHAGMIVVEAGIAPITGDGPALQGAEEGER